MPVAGIAAGAYLLMLVALSRVRRGPARAAWRVLLGLATAVAGSAGWFIYVQQARLDAWCGLCMAEHAIGLVLAALVILYATGATGGGGWAAALAGLLAVAAL
ncbi:MAG: hypothetical protein GVY28_06285, partial [Alphaproteobacteria bacterium]|nr:hypothetical protein [Alphaproteobacteria bacterium]